jgi:hypothetical protein
LLSAINDRNLPGFHVLAASLGLILAVEITPICPVSLTYKVDKILSELLTFNLVGSKTIAQSPGTDMACLL